MANGIGERPLPSVEAEKSLMGTTGIYGTTKFEVPNGSTRYLVFSSGQYKGGFLVVGCYSASSTAEKSGLYILGSGVSGAAAMITLTPVKAITLTNATITPLNDSVIEFKTPSGYYLWGAVFMFYGDRPTISSTNPTA